MAMLLAGGVGSRLNVLARVRAKPAVPFGGMYRIIDFTLSNAMNSGIDNVGILTQYRPYSLMKHIGTGVPWDFIGRSRGAKILPPKTGAKDSDWYQGTADAVAQNLEYIEHHHPQYVLILSGDHIYYMDYSELIDFHSNHNGGLTIATRDVSLHTASQFGIAVTDATFKILDWEEKPENPRSTRASMGVYVFDTEFLFHCLNNRTGNDFGQHIIPWVVKKSEAYAYPFRGYWQDVGTIHALWEANMDLLKEDSGLEIEEWQISTNLDEEGLTGDRLPAFIAHTANVKQSIISAGCCIKGNVKWSVLSPGVTVEEGASVTNSIIFHDCYIEKNAALDLVIMDKDGRIGEGALIGRGEKETPNQLYPAHLNTGITLAGKNAIIKPGSKIGRNCLIECHVEPDDFQKNEYRSGDTIRNLKRNLMQGDGARLAEANRWLK